MIDNKRHTVRLISTRLGPTTESDPNSRPDRGRPTVLLAGAPPSRSAMNRRWGLGLETRGSLRSPVPTDVLTLVRSRGRAVSDEKLHRFRRRHWTVPPLRLRHRCYPTSTPASSTPTLWLAHPSPPIVYLSTSLSLPLILSREKPH